MDTYAEKEMFSKLLITFHHIKLWHEQGLGENKATLDQRLLLILHEHYVEVGLLVQIRPNTAG